MIPSIANKVETTTRVAPILLADDSPEDRILIPRAIKKAGLLNPLVSVEDGLEALKYLSGEGHFGDRMQFPLPALVLLDIKMPRCDGFEVLAWIRSRLKERIPVVMLTSSNLEEDIRRATQLGADSYFVKPACFTELVSMIKRLQGDRFPGSFMPVTQRPARFV